MATDYFTMMRDVVGGYGKGVGIARDRQYEDEKRAREKVIQGREDATYERAQTQIKDEDAAVQQYGLLSTQGVQNKANIQANDMDFDMAVEATGRGLPMPAANPQMPEWKPATDLDKNRGLQGISRARRDWNGVASLQKEEKGLEWDEGYSTLLKSYTGAEDQIGQGVQGVNTGSGKLTVGDRAKDGSLPIAIVKPDGRATFLSLPHSQQAQFFAAGGMVDKDPMKALAVMAGLNKDLAAAFAADNNLSKTYAELLDKEAGRRETNRHNRVTEGNATAGLALRREEGKALKRGAPVQMVDAQGNAALMQPVQSADGTLRYEPVDLPQGMRFPKQVDPAAIERRAAALEGKPMPGLGADGRPQVYDADTAYSMARSQLYGQDAPGGDVVGGYTKAILAKQGSPAAGDAPKPPVAGMRPPASAQQQAYDAWQASKPGWFAQTTPTSGAREKAAEQAYLEALRNPTR